MSKPLNVWSMSDEEIGRKMSNFAHTPFVIDDLEFGSVEAFYVWILLSATGTERKREKVRPMWGLHAKRLAPRIKPPCVIYRGSTMKLGGPEHIALIRRALRAKLDAYPEVARDFVATAPRPIAHDTGHRDNPDAEFPRETFCRLLHELRDELASEIH